VGTEPVWVSYGPELREMMGEAAYAVLASCARSAPWRAPGRRGVALAMELLHSGKVRDVWATGTS